jgi:hypothetical protein
LIPSASRYATTGLWHRLAAFLLVVAALGLPVNDLIRYALLIFATVVIFSGSVSTNPKAWFAPVAVVVMAVLGKVLLPAPHIDEGHNVFIVDGPGGALEAGLPPEAFAFMKKLFDAQYPPERHCARETSGCWRGLGFPDRAYAFSADGIFQEHEFSRRVTGIDFTDPTWLRLGFVNERKYNWNSIYSDVDRVSRLRGAEVFRHAWQAVFHPWRLLMPWYVVYRFPADFVGSKLCWTGDVLWEGANQDFMARRHFQFDCRTIEPTDVGRRIFGVAIAKDAPLAMALVPTFAIRLRQWVEPLLSAFGVFLALGMLVRCERRRVVLPCTLIVLSLLVVLLNDASFIGGVRAFDGGDDGLFYDGTSRLILQHLLHGDVALALQGEEKVFYYGGPGLRYLRAFEHIVFGETYLGYLSLMLILPFAVLAAFRRFLPARAALPIPRQRPFFLPDSSC